MRPEYYADLYRRYQCYVRNLGGNEVRKIACGAGGGDYNWTEVLMREAGSMMWGLSLHHYSWSGAEACDFDEAGWFKLMKQALHMEELVARHSAIMDKHDPYRKVALVVDEWGAWHHVEKGTNGGFLYQQNTVRDAVLAGATLNILNNACGRVRMANIAQTVNVLQAMILTDGARMLTTPTFHVFEMYTVHHDATLLPVDVRCGEAGPEEARIRQVSVSASVDASGKVHLTLCNLDPAVEVEVECVLRGKKAGAVTGRVLTGKAMQDHNTFDKPDAVKPSVFGGASVDGEGLKVKLPPHSVVVLEIS